MDDRTMETGRILEVDSVVSGGELLDDHAANETTLRLEDVGEFSEDGGELVIGEVTYVYLSKDDDNSTIELETELGVDVEAGDRVDIYPISIEKWALVELLSEEDAISARVPHNLYALLDDTIRESWDQESVLVYIDSSGDWVVYDLIGQSASFDGRYIDPRTLPQQSDGEAPAISPAPVLRSGIGMLFVGWVPIANPDLVTYDIYIGTFSGFPVDGTTLAGSVTGGTIFVARTLPNGDPFLENTQYWVRIVARDVDGAADPGPEDSSTVEMPVDQGQFDDLDTRLDALRTDLTTAEGNIGNLNTELSTLDDDLSAAKADILTAQGAADAAQTAANTADAKAVTAQSAADAAQADADAAEQAAIDAATLAGSKNRTFVQGTEPAPAESTTGDIWYNDADGFHPKRYDGTNWVDVQDQAILDAAAAANDAANAASAAQSEADAASSAAAAADTKATNAQNAADAADAKAVAAQTDADAAATAATNAQNTANSANQAASDADAKAVAAQSAADTAQADADAANQAALDAAGIAEGKGKTIIQSAAPDAADRLPQNLWIDTTGGNNTPKTWNGSAWVAVTDKAAIDAANAAAQAQSDANAAQSAAASAQTTADNAATAANAAQGDATQALSDAATASSAAATAHAAANDAQGAADAAQATGDLAQQTADSAATEAAEAKSIGQDAQATGDQATQDAADAWDEAAKKLARVAAGPGVKTFHNPLNWGKSVNGETGSIVVRTPITFGNYMTTISFRGYNYHTTTGREISAVVNFYAYSGGASGDPSFPQTAQTSSGEVSITFRLAKDADEKVVIILDNSEGIWHYPKLSVTEMLMGQATPPDSFADGWTAEVASDLSDLTILNTPARRDLDDTHSLTQGWRKTGTVEIDGGHIAADSVTALQILAGTIGATELAAESVIADKLAANAVTAGKIEAGAVTTTKLDALAVTAAKIAADAVVAGKIAAGAVVAGNIAANAVTTGTLAAEAVTSAKIDALAVTAAKIAADAVTASKIKAGEVVAGKLGANAVVANNIEAGAVIAAKIGAGAVITEKLDAGAVTAVKVAANAIEAIHIKAGEITAEHIAANAITTAELDAEAINGMTITGALFQTSALANRGLKFDDTGLRAFDNNGNQNFFLDPQTGTGEIKAGPIDGNHVHIGHTNHVALNPGAGAVEFWSDDVLAGGIAGDLGYVNFLAQRGLDLKVEDWPTGEGDPVRGGRISLLNDAGFRGLRIVGGPLDGTDLNSSVVDLESMGHMNVRTFNGGEMRFGTGVGGGHIRFNSSNFIVTEAGLSASPPGEIRFVPGGHFICDPGESFIIRPNLAVAITAGSYFNAQVGTYFAARTGNNSTTAVEAQADGSIFFRRHSTTSSSASAAMGTAGQLLRVTSRRDTKLLIEPIEDERLKSLLDIEVVSWFDRRAAEDHADELSGNPDAHENETPLTRIPGLIAEDLEATGLKEFVTYDSQDGSIQSVAYDRIGVAWIPLVRELFARIATLEERING